jgi:hypothetical protein
LYQQQQHAEHSVCITLTFLTSKHMSLIYRLYMI